MRTDNALSTNMLIFCNSMHESGSPILLLFVKFENIRNRSTFLFFDLYFSV